MSIGQHLYALQYDLHQWLVGSSYKLRHLKKQTSARQDDSLPCPRKVLLVMSGLIGDSVMCTPAIVEARRLWPKASITLLGRKHNCELLADCPLLDDCVEAPAVPFSLRNRKGVAALKGWLREKDFDLALILLGDQFASVLADAGIPIRAGVRGHLLEPCLTHAYTIGSPREWGPHERLNALRSLGYEVADSLPRLWVSDRARAESRQRLSDSGLQAGEPYAVVHPFGSTRRQWWPVERVTALADELWNNYRLRTVLIGGPETQNQVGDSMTSKLVDTTGRLSLRQLMAVIEGAAPVVSTDSGPFHIAGALGRTVVGLFRARRPEHANRYPQAHVLLGRNESCQKQCAWDRCSSEPCRQLESITCSQVTGVIERLETNLMVEAQL